MEERYSSLGSPSDEPALHKKYASQTKVGIVEIGVLFGETTLVFLESAKSVKVYGIDPIIPDSMNNSLIGDINKINNLRDKYTNFVFIQDYSYNVVKTWKEPFDYLFIDASHLYDDVKQDFNDWFPLLEISGVVAIHDSAADRGGPYWWPGPTKLARELLSRNCVEYLETVGALTLFRKLSNE